MRIPAAGHCPAASPPVQECGRHSFGAMRFRVNARSGPAAPSRHTVNVRWVCYTVVAAAVVVATLVVSPVGHRRFSGLWAPSSPCALVDLPPSLTMPATLHIPGLSDALRNITATTGRCEVVLTFSTSTYLPMLRNFLITTARVRPLHDVVVVALTPGLCSTVTADAAFGAVHCVGYPVEKTAGDFGSTEFADLVNVKTEAALVVNHAGYAVLLVDGDISFVKDPVPILRTGNPAADLQIQVCVCPAVCGCQVHPPSGHVRAPP